MYQDLVKHCLTELNRHTYQLLLPLPHNFQTMNPHLSIYSIVKFISVKGHYVTAVHIQERQCNKLCYWHPLFINYLSKRILTRVMANELFPFVYKYPIFNPNSNSQYSFLLLSTHSNGERKPRNWKNIIYYFKLIKHPNHKGHLLRFKTQTQKILWG